MWKEFKAFAMRGNIIDLAVAVIIGAAFGKVVTSLVADIVMPPIGLALGGVDFASLFVDLSGKGYGSLAAAKAAGAPTINYGMFLNTIIDFVIIAFMVFMVVKAAARAMPKAPIPVSTKECPRCFTAISLKATRCPNCTTDLA